MTASLDEAAAKRAFNSGEPQQQPAEIDLTNISALTESLTEATMSMLSPTAPVILEAEMNPITVPESLTPGVLVLPDGSVENIDRKTFLMESPVELSRGTTITVEPSAPVVDVTEPSAPALVLEQDSVVCDNVANDELLAVDAQMREVEIDEIKTPMALAELGQLSLNPLLNQVGRLLHEADDSLCQKQP